MPHHISRYSLVHAEQLLVRGLARLHAKIKTRKAFKKESYERCLKEPCMIGGEAWRGKRDERKRRESAMHHHTRSRPTCRKAKTALHEAVFFQLLPNSQDAVGALRVASSGGGERRKEEEEKGKKRGMKRTKEGKKKTRASIYASQKPPLSQRLLPFLFFPPHSFSPGANVIHHFLVIHQSRAARGETSGEKEG